MTERTGMTWTRVEEILPAYGADPARWPDAERAAAEAVLATDPARARTLLERERSLDQTLDSWAAPAVSEKARASMATAATPGFISRVRGAFNAGIGWRGPLWQPAGAFACALLLGMVAGGAVPATAIDIAGFTDLDPAAEAYGETAELEDLLSDFDILDAEGDPS